MKYNGLTGWPSVNDDAAITLADTGYYDPDTNIEVTELAGDLRFERVRLIRLGEDDYHILKDHRSMVHPYLTTNRKGQFVRDRRPAYWETSHWSEHPFYSVNYMIEGESRSKYLHPRFTELKRAIRDLMKQRKRAARIA